jgi:hypothetical protein
MFKRIRLLTLLVAAAGVTAAMEAANLDGSSPEVGNTEAGRLYTEAND